MTITKRTDKGSALTFAEMDENIRDLREDTDLTRVLNNGNETTLDIVTTGSVTADLFYGTLVSANAASEIDINTLYAANGNIDQLLANNISTFTLSVDDSATVENELTANTLNVHTINYVDRNFQPGEIIEVVARQCDGGSVTTQSGTYTFENVTAQVELNNSTHTRIPGSFLNYTPPAGTKTVIYEFSFSWRRKDGNSISHFKLNIDGTDVVYSRVTLNINSATVYSDLAHYKWIIDCNASTDDANTGAMTSWTTAKNIELLGRDYGGSNEGYLFGTHYWDGSGGNVFMQPRLSITAIA